MMLRRAWIDAGSPDFRAIGDHVGLTHVSVFRILRGRALQPRTRNVKAIAEYLCATDPDRAAEIVHAYGVHRDAISAPNPHPHKPHHAERNDDLADILRDGLADITAAIRELRRTPTP